MRTIAPSIFLIVCLIFYSCGKKNSATEAFRDTANKTEQYLTMITAWQAEIRDIINSYNNSVSPDRKLTLQVDPTKGLSDNSMKILQKHISDESDVSCQNLLERIPELQGLIDSHLHKINTLLASLSLPHKVKRGETHYRLSMDYLMQQHGLSRQQSDSIVSRVALNSDILVGFNIWFLFEDGEFSTLVTQGKAHISPTMFAKIIKKQILDSARAQGNPVEFESILDSLKRCGALLTNVQKAATVGI